MPAGDRRGFALVAVLWAVVLAAALAAELHAGVRGDQRAVASARAAARARWAARAGLAAAAEALRARLARTAAVGGALTPRDTLVVPADSLDLDGVVVRWRVVDARSRLSLNLAAPDELRALFEAVGHAPGDAARLAMAVVRRRADHARPFEAAPRDTGDVPLRPPAGAFAAVEELRAVPGIAAETYERAAPYLTVASDGRINLNTAPEPVLRTLPEIDAAAARAIVAKRRERALGSAYELADALPRIPRPDAERRMAALVARAAFAPRHAEVRATAAPPGTPLRARVRAVAVLGEGSRVPLVTVVER